MWSANRLVRETRMDSFLLQKKLSIAVDGCPYEARDTRVSFN